MAELVVHRLIDDVDKTDITDSDGGGRVEFALHGIAYEVDLSTENRAALEAALQPYIDVARRAAGKPRRPSRKTRASTPAPAQESSDAKRPARKTVAKAKAAAKKPRPRKSAASKASAARAERAAIRQWASDNGYSVAPRGKISDEIVQAYNAAP